MLVVGAGITGIYQLYRAREAGFSVQLLEAGGGVGGTWFWNRYPGARFDSESYTYGYLFSPRAVRRVGVAGALRRAARDRALPQPRRRPVRPAARHALRRPGRPRRRTTSAIGHVDGDRRRRLRRYRARFLVAATGVLSVPFFPDVPGRDDFRGDAATTPVGGRRRPSTSRASGSRSIGTGSSGVQIVPAIADEVASLTVYQRTANWCTPLNNAPITADEQAQLRADFEAIRETLNTSRARVPPRAARPRRVRRLRRASGARSTSRCGTARASRSSRATTPTCCSTRRRTTRGARSSPTRSAASSHDPGDRREADPEGPPVRRAPAPVRDRLLRGVQPTRTSRSSTPSRRRSCA